MCSFLQRSVLIVQRRASAEWPRGHTDVASSLRVPASRVIRSVLWVPRTLGSTSANFYGFFQTFRSARCLHVPYMRLPPHSECYAKQDHIAMLTEYSVPCRLCSNGFHGLTIIGLPLRGCMRGNLRRKVIDKSSCVVSCMGSDSAM